MIFLPQIYMYSLELKTGTINKFYGYTKDPILISIIHFDVQTKKYVINSLLSNVLKFALIFVKVCCSELNIVAYFVFEIVLLEW